MPALKSKMTRDNNQKSGILLFYLGHQQLALALYRRQQEIKLLNFWRQSLASLQTEEILSASRQIWQKAGEELAGLRPAETIFLISPFWVKADGSLLEGKKAILSQLASQLHLHPLGFLLADEALIHHFQRERGQSPSFISVALDNPSEVSLVHLGKIKSRLRLEISADRQLPEQLEKALGQLDYPGMFPPNFIFWGRNQEEFAVLQAECEKYSWTGRRDSLFLQIPQFNFMSWQQFFAIFSSLIEERFQEQGEEGEKAMGLSSDEEEEGKTERISLPAGFAEQDLSLDEALPPPKETTLPLASEEISGALPSAPPPPKEPLEKKHKKLLKLKALPFRFRWPNLRASIINGFLVTKRLGLILPFGLAAGLLLSLAAINSFWLARQVIVFITPQQLELKTRVGKGDVSFQPLSIELSEKGKVAVTGTTTVGEKALGTVVIFNRTSRPLLLASGTKLEAKSGLTFSLRESVRIASKTADLNSGIDRLGKTESSVIAAKFGSEYNLPKGTLFRVDNYTQDECLARAKDDFSGGSNRKVKAVSKEDLSALKKQLTEKILAKAGEAMSAKAGADLEIVSPKLDSKVVDFTPQRHLGEEADSLAGGLKMQINAQAVRRDDLRNLALRLIQKRLTNKSELDEKSLQVKVQSLSGSGSAGKLQIAIKAMAYPRFDLSQLRQRLKGATKAKAQKIIHHYPRVARVEIHNQWKILDFWPWLPWLDKNITVKIRGE